MEHKIGVGIIVGLALTLTVLFLKSKVFNQTQKIILGIFILFPPGQIVLALLFWLYNQYNQESKHKQSRLLETDSKLFLNKNKQEQFNFLSNRQIQPIAIIVYFLKIGLAILLVSCLLEDSDYGYFQIIRFLALCFFSFFALYDFINNRPVKCLVYISLAVLFQPLIKISLGRELWNIVDVITALGLFIDAVFSYDNLKQNVKIQQHNKSIKQDNSNDFIYYIVEDSKQSAPLTFNQLKEKKIKEDSLIWRNGLENWIKAKDLSELKNIIYYAPPPLPVEQKDEPEKYKIMGSIYTFEQLKKSLEKGEYLLTKNSKIDVIQGKNQKRVVFKDYEPLKELLKFFPPDIQF